MKGSRRRAGRRPRPRVPPGWTVPRVAYLYEDPSARTLKTAEVGAFLRKALGFRCILRGDYLEELGGSDREGLARAIAATKVRNLARPFAPAEPLYGEVEFERRLLGDPSKRAPGILYDAFEYAAMLRGLLPPRERGLRAFHLVFGHRLLGTYGEDGRYHARAVVASVPSIVSTSGIVEAPAKPEGYYRLKAQLSAALGAVPFEAAKAPFEGRFIDYDDDRLTEVAKGYALQAAMYHATREAFCASPTCRLFDAHRQAEVIRAQIESGRLCRRHAEAARRLRALASAREG